MAFTAIEVQDTADAPPTGTDAHSRIMDTHTEGSGMRQLPTLLSLLLCMFYFTSTSQSAEQDRSGPTLTLQSVVYQVGDKWYCPLCRQEVENKDRSGIDLKLSLSEWHDVLIDKDYFRSKIRYITDEELVQSLHIATIDPALQTALKAKNYTLVSTILHKYFTTRTDNNRLSAYDAQVKKYFITTDEFRQEVMPGSPRYDTIVSSAKACFTPEKGFTLHGVHWGKRIDFNHHYSHISKYGVHYLQFIDDQINYYLLTGDPGTPKAFETAFNQWYDQLDSVKTEQVIHMIRSYDFIWYELGLANRNERLINAHRVFARHLSPETNKRLLKIILGSTRWLDQCLQRTPFHPYNWQTHTALTASYAAVAYPEFREAESWLDRGRKTMVLHLENDILDDGGYVERTSSYASYMFSVFYRYMVMLEHFRNDSSLRDQYLKRLEKNMEFYVLTNTPVGVNPPFNDAHRGKNLLPLFREMGVFFNRGDFIGAARHEFSPEDLASIPVQVTAPKTTSIDFPDSRFAVMRDSWDPRSYYMIINYGDWQNHCHFDQLDFEIYANGVPIALDAGLGPLGYLDSLQVSWYKHPQSHNMVTINQAVPEKMDKPGYDKYWSPLKQSIFFAATHDGYVRYQTARHRRHIVYSKARYWLIIDEVRTERTGQEMDFNLHTPCSMAETEDGYVSAQDNGFLIKQDHQDAQTTKRILSRGGADLNGLFGEPGNRDIDWLIFRKVLTGDRTVNRMATIIYPFASKASLDPANVSVVRLALKDTAAAGYSVRLKEREDIILVSDGSQRQFTDAIEGDFTYGLISFSAGRVDYAGISGATRYRIDGLGENTFDTRMDFEYRK